MIVQDYIKGRFQSFEIQLSDADLLDMSLNGSLELDAVITADNMRGVSVAIAGFIPSLLLRPQSVSEGGVSIGFSHESLKTYYALLCKQYDLRNGLTPTITFMPR